MISRPGDIERVGFDKIAKDGVEGCGAEDGLAISV